ncbi:hypothetical protein XPA_008078 [Xanthoria parietina]
MKTSSLRERKKQAVIQFGLSSVKPGITSCYSSSFSFDRLPLCDFDRIHNTGFSSPPRPLNDPTWWTRRDTWVCTVELGQESESQDFQGLLLRLAAGCYSE